VFFFKQIKKNMQIRNIIKNVTPKSISTILKRIVIGYDVNTYSFSQGGEDVILKNIFWNKIVTKTNGFFIDIGAYHPVKGSNTFLFYNHGWNGINIDPNPYTINLFNKKRKRDINIQAAISDKEEESTYYYYGETFSQNSLSKEFMQKFGNSAPAKEMKINTFRLETILNQHSHKFNQIDFLNIDVEGLDYNVLISNDWNKFRPKIVIVEIEGITIDDIIKDKSSIFLKQNQYSFYTRVPMGKISSAIFIDERIS